MGTLFNQRVRLWERNLSDDVSDKIYFLKQISNKTGLTYDQVLETCKVLEMQRRNDMYVQNGDAFDEQMAGFGQLIQEFMELYEERNK